MRHNKTSFFFRCMINQQFFYLIIDNDSYDNIIGRETIFELGLNSEKHFEPYTIG